MSWEVIARFKHRHQFHHGITPPLTATKSAVINAQTMNDKAPMQFETLIGAFIVNFGAAEMATFDLISKLCSDPMVRDLASDMALGKRLALVCELVKRSNLPEDRKKRAIELWNKIAKLSEIRNKVAHNPIGKTDSGFVIAVKSKQNKGIGPIKIAPLDISEVAKAGSQLVLLLKELLKEF